MATEMETQQVSDTEAAAAASTQEDNDGVMTLIVDDETAAELSKLLDLYEAPPPPIKVRFIDDPYSSLLVFQSSSSYVTINGNDESCGSSFSDSDSSVMASVHLGAAAAARRFCGDAWDGDYAEARDWGMDVMSADVDVDLDLDLDGFLIDGEDGFWGELLGEDMFG